MATVVADMLVAVMLLVAVVAVAVMLLVPVVVAVATLAVVVAAMLAVAAVMLAVAAVMLAVAAAAMLVAAAMDMVVTADTSKRQPPSQSAHYARSGGASQLRRFAFASLFYRSSSSSMVLKSVFSSRYLTITGA
jgi:predicted membrane protein